MPKPKKEPETKQAESAEFQNLLHKATALHMLKAGGRARKNDVLAAALRVYVERLEQP